MPTRRFYHTARLGGMLLLLLFTLNAHAERIISLSPAITEILFALDRGSEVVGVSAYSAYPKDALELPEVGGYFQPNLETILSLRPTLVIAQPNHADILSQLKSLGITTKQIELESIKQIKEAIVQLDTSERQHADALLLAIDDAIKHGYSPQNNMRVIIVFGLYADLRDNIYISGKNLFFNEIIELCGAVNAYEHATPKQPVLNYESLIALNPDTIIILNNNHTSDTENALKAWQALPIKAAKNGAIHVLEHNFISIPSHRIALSIDAVCKAIHD